MGARKVAMFEGIPTAPPDAIFGLTEAHSRDPNPQKINLGAGVFRDEYGKTPILDSVKQAERRLWEQEVSKTYLAIAGDPRFARDSQRLQFGGDHPLLDQGRLLTVHTPGGTGAIRIAADFLKAHRPDTTVWMPDPTWINHPQIFHAAGLAIREFPYLDSSCRRLDFAALVAGLNDLTAGDVVILHGCCHNPSGVDPSLAQWSQLAGLLRERRAVPLFDFAYQGFGQGLEEDAQGLRALCNELTELIICSSFSKNFALYNERVGALTVVAADGETASAILSQIKMSVRACYSNPPAHGAAIVATILEDEDLRQQWEGELDAMRHRIHDMRQLFVSGLDRRGVKLGPDGNEFLLGQQGMFSFSGLDPEQVERLRQEHSIYIVGSGRVNFAGMTPGNMDRLCDAIAEVV
jgi:aspartate aminotransferase/aromatic-amino-acid transaminase